MPPPACPPRSRLGIASSLPFIVLIGLASRSDLPMPGFAATYGGDTLYAVLIFALLALVWPAASSARLGLGAAGVCLLIELSQLWRAEWLDAIPASRLGALALGRGFVWSDLACYAAGASLAAGADAALRRRRHRP